MGILSQFYSLSWALASVLMAVYVCQKLRTYNRLKAFKGPFSSGWSEAWHIFAILSFKSHLKYDEVCKKYGTSHCGHNRHKPPSWSEASATDAKTTPGPIARVGPNDLVTSSPDLLAHMSAVRSPYTRSEWFYRATRSRPDKDHVFSELDEKRHAKLRQRMGAGVGQA